MSRKRLVAVVIIDCENEADAEFLSQHGRLAVETIEPLTTNGAIHIDCHGDLRVVGHTGGPDATPLKDEVPL